MLSVIHSIAIWGDSILKGVLFNPEKCKYTLLKENCASLVAQRLGLSLTNRSIMGRTIEQGHASLDSDLQKGRTGDIAIIEFGGNDCDFIWEEISKAPDAPHSPKTPLDVFEAQLLSMIETVREKGIQPLLMTLPPLHAQRYFDFITRGLNAGNILSWLGGDIQMIYRWHERYSNAVMRIASETSSRVVDIRDAFLSRWNYADLLCADGIHPNEKGHRCMADAFISYAETL